MKANAFLRIGDTGKRKRRETDDPGGVGWEVVREVLACPACAVRSENEEAPR
jgi:hypothetical protein